MSTIKSPLFTFAKKTPPVTKDSCVRATHIFSEEEYDGDLLGDEKHGQGKSYDENGKLLYNGAWKEGIHNGPGKSPLGPGMMNEKMEKNGKILIMSCNISELV